MVLIITAYFFKLFILGVNYMTTQTQTNQQGFTLVELAIVLVIVGLLIGGILKGQELIGNAQLSSQVSQMRGIQTAFNGFRDQFNALPGDFNRAAAVIESCGGAACTNGNGNNVVNQTIGAAPGAATTEGVQFFRQMAGANLLSGMDNTATVSFGQALPTASTGGGFLMGDSRAGAGTNYNVANMRSGVYLVHNATPTAVGATSGILTPSQAARIDRRMDDGMPRTGDVILQTGAANCAAAAATDVYLERNSDDVCSISYRMGQ
ncbi:MAG: hypothetical protein CL565_00430 [Alphaproteobacteria bacterium]|nr:hypothetical protein [Alphaproteobacteria bacterium]|tara:strand:+ start:3923 stop:4714 length:792 start_codon:yes stop_codon:yes gene_type:complete